LEKPYLDDMSLQKNLKELLDEGVIDNDVAARIEGFYNNKSEDSSSKILIIFGILGALLIGLGIILIINHNWDLLPKWLKTIFAFVPLIIGQALCFYSLWKKDGSRLWSESSAIFLTLGIGACIGLVSQIYNLEGSLQGFLEIWMIIGLPIIYIMNSTNVAILFLLAVISYTMYGYGAKDWTSTFGMYILLFAAFVPFYFLKIRKGSKENALNILHWLVPITMIVGVVFLYVASNSNPSIGLVLLFAILYMIGHLQIFEKASLFRNGYLVIGALGTVGVLLAHSFVDIFEEIDFYKDLFGTQTYISLLHGLLLVIAIGGLYYHQKNRASLLERPMMPVFLIFICIYLLSTISVGTSTLLVNLLVLGLGVLTVRTGIEKDHLGILNYGLLIITVLLTCRFFDVGIPFIIRGILFIIIGCSFFIANRELLKKRKSNHG